MEALIPARNLVARTLQHSDAVSSAVEASSRNLRRLNSDLLRSLHRRISTLSALSLQADHAVGPASAHSSVLLLQHSLCAARPSADLSGYLASVLRLEQALSFLTENCALAIHWLNDVASLLDESSAADQRYALSVKRSLTVLGELKAMEVRERLPGGVLSLAMDKLELQLRRILETEVPAGSLVRPIVDRLRSNGRGPRVGPIYVEARVSVLRSRLPDARTPGGIAQWLIDVEFAVKQVVRQEQDVCRAICDGLGSSVISMDCYAEIVAESGFLSLLGFGSKAVTAAKRDAMKLLKLLDVFGALDGLRPDFNKLFGGEECGRVRGATRDLVRSVVEGACEVFGQLAVEVERQPEPGRGPHAGVPPLVAFVADYCRVLVGDQYRPVLLQVLSIQRTWKREAGPPPLQVLLEEMWRILRALEVNLHKWSSGLDNPALARSFLISNYRYLHDNLKGTELPSLLGQDWLRQYRAKMDYTCGQPPSTLKHLPIPGIIHR